jgi:hypothetical protein
MTLPIAERHAKSWGAPAIVRLVSLARVSDALAGGASACIVHRKLPSVFQDLALEVPSAPFARRAELGTNFSAQGLIEGAFSAPLGAALVEDIDQLVQTLVAVLPQATGTAELCVVTGDECRKFHVDHYALRLLVTYVGPGTELVRPEAVNWSALETGGDDFERANQWIVRDRSGIVRAQTGDAVLVRGSRDGSKRAAVHRSPPISSTGVHRLVFKLTLE